MRGMRRPALLLTITLALGGAGAVLARQPAPAPVVYTMRFPPTPESHSANVEVRIPTKGADTVELMLPVWSPGYYRVEDYAANIVDLRAESPTHAALAVSKPQENHWLVAAGGSPSIVVSYAIRCDRQFVTGCWVGSDYSVINGPSTFVTPVDHAGTPYEVDLELPARWKNSMTSMTPLDGGGDRYAAPNYDVFIDSPIVLGTISTHEFTVGETRHILADFGDLGAWDGAVAAAALKRIVEEHRRMLGELPFRRYVFLNAFRRGAGGLEHLNSTLLSSAPHPTDPAPTLRWLKYVSHDYFHAINVKRLRPIELGPFDYEHLPKTPSLWISEGLTTYYGDLAVVRSGVGSHEDFLDGLSKHIRTVQRSPGRLVQTLSEASLDVGTSSTSGIGGDPNRTVSYYDKGPIVGFLLDAKIRRATNGARSLDDAMRVAYRRYSGAHGFTPKDFQGAASEVAGVDLSGFFHRTLDTTDELDYREALDWFGLEFAPGADLWTLRVRSDASNDQQQHLAQLLGRSEAGTSFSPGRTGGAKAPPVQHVEPAG
jgi:predicted metalloprotease with PDZ domain